MRACLWVEQKFSLAISHNRSTAITSASASNWGS
jgi:hypothetical protein